MSYDAVAEPTYTTILGAHTKVVQCNRKAPHCLSVGLQLTFMRKTLRGGRSPAGVEEANGSALFVLERMSKRRVVALPNGW